MIKYEAVIAGVGWMNQRGALSAAASEEMLRAGEGIGLEPVATLPVLDKRAIAWFTDTHRWRDFRDIIDAEVWRIETDIRVHQGKQGWTRTERHYLVHEPNDEAAALIRMCEEEDDDES